MKSAQTGTSVMATDAAIFLLLIIESVLSFVWGLLAFPGSAVYQCGSGLHAVPFGFAFVAFTWEGVNQVEKATSGERIFLQARIEPDSRGELDCAIGQLK